MINICVSPTNLSLSILWKLTVPVIRQLFRMKKLDEFKWVGVQIVPIDGKTDYGRVLRVESLVAEIENLPANAEDDLLNGSIWTNNKFTCYWYWDKEKIPG